MNKQLLEKINARISERSILKHPFYQAWTEGTLPKETLKIYAKQYYKHVDAFPQYISAVHCKIDNPQDRLMMLTNLMDEEHGDKNHPKLWRHFAQETGVTDQEIDGEQANEETTAFVNHFKSITQQGSVAQGIAALYTYESQIPKVSEEKIRGLVEHYNLGSEKALEYFEVHKEADVEHSAEEAELLMKYAEGESEEAILKAVEDTLDAYWNMLSGVEKQAQQEA